MTRMIKLSIAPATETHCGDRTGRCRFLLQHVHHCSAFARPEVRYDLEHREFLRLPACIAAEVGEA